MFSPLCKTVLAVLTTFLLSCGGGSGSSGSSNTTNTPPLTSLTFPSPPSGVNTVSSDKSVSISWNSVSNADQYHVYWSTTAGVSTNDNKINNASSPYTHSNLTNDVIYYYIVTAENSMGESAPSSEATGTPSSPYASIQTPFHLGTTPLTGHEESINNSVRKYYYTLDVVPGATYMFSLSNVVNSAEIHIFSEGDWEIYGVNLLCTDTILSYSKRTPHCTAQAPISGRFYIRLGIKEAYAEEISLRVTEIVNQGTSISPIALGSLPLTDVKGTVLEAGESVYRIDVTPGLNYRVALEDWLDSQATLSELYLTVFDGPYTDINGVNKLCQDFGGNSGTDHQHRLPFIHCMTGTVSNNFLTVVTQETQYGDGAIYTINASPTASEGNTSAPINLTGDTFVYHGEVAAADAYTKGYSYYRLTVTPNTDYMIDLRGMAQENDLVITNSTFTAGLCNSRESNLVDESCEVNSGSGDVYVLIDGETGETDQFILSAIPTPTNAIPNARYENEGFVDQAIDLGGLVIDRLSTVGAESSYYSLPVSTGDVLNITLDAMNADVDLAVFSDALFSQRLCASRKTRTNIDSCDITVPDNTTRLYIQVDGQFATNNGSWSTNTEFSVGGMFNLSIQ